MTDSPLFARIHDLLYWLLPATLRFPKQHRFVLARRLQEKAFDLQEQALGAALSHKDIQPRLLRQVDVTLTQLRYHLRLAHELALLTPDQYAHVAKLVAEIGRLLGGWMKKAAPAGGAHPAVL
jgi:hypothetical protein